MTDPSGTTDELGAPARNAWAGEVPVALLSASICVMALLVFAGVTLRPYATMGTWALSLFLAAGGFLLTPTRGVGRTLCAIAVVLSLVIPATISPAQAVGDWPEYYLYETSVLTHLSLDQRRPQDEDIYKAEAASEGMDTTPGLRMMTTTGKIYPYHFWLSSLAVTPVGLVLKLAGLHWLRAFAIVNGLLIALAFFSLALWSGFRDSTRRLVAAFWVLSPVTWYLGWPSAEVWSAAFVVFGIVAFTRKRRALAVLLISLAAAQNPPLLVVVGLMAVVGVVEKLRTREWFAAGLVAAACIPAFSSNLFYLMTFGTPNLIISQGEAGWQFVSVLRMFSFYLDLSQGIAPYAPVLVVGWLGATVLAVRRRNWSVLAFSGGTVLVTMLTAMGGDWGSGCIGIIRWAVWQLPVLAWIVAETLEAEPGMRWGAPVLVAGQAVVALAVLIYPAYAPDHLTHGPIAKAVLNTAPQLYSPEPDIFFDRTNHYEVSDSYENVLALPTEPAVYRNPQGRVMKVLFPESGIATAAAQAGVPVSVLRQKMYDAGRPGLYYVDRP